MFAPGQTIVLAHTNMFGNILAKICRLVIVVASLLTVVGGFTEFGYNLGNLGRICINIRVMIIFRRSGETLADTRGNTDDGTINIGFSIIQTEFLR